MATFDASTLLAAYLHPRVCAGHETLIEPADCLAVQRALPQWLDELHASGMGLVPLSSISLLERLFDRFTAQMEPEPEQAVVPNTTASRALAATFIQITYRDGQVKREGPYARWMAEMLIGELNFQHSPDMHSSILIPEPAWIDSIISSLALGNADDMAAS